MAAEQHVDLPWSAQSSVAQDSTLHQLAPYVGRVKPSIARSLLQTYTSSGDVIVDPFCGCGTIPLEAAIAGRNVVAGDINPYAVLLTRAKLGAPMTLKSALGRLETRWACARDRVAAQDLRQVPAWVRKFFHRETLREALALRDELVERRDWFLLACLLGILHHQRPGFLSYPSSHLVPYLRNKRYPRDDYPEMYAHRAVQPRLRAKVERAYRRMTWPNGSYRVHQTDACKIATLGQIDAIVTSPPYMNELDYVRDNRLRLWFLDRRLAVVTDIKKKGREEVFRTLMKNTLCRLAVRLNKSGRIVLIVGDTNRGSRRVNSSSIVEGLFTRLPELSSFRCDAVIEDEIPDIRRSRRDRTGTKRETILVYSR